MLRIKGVLLHTKARSSKVSQIFGDRNKFVPKDLASIYFHLSPSIVAIPSDASIAEDEIITAFTFLRERGRSKRDCKGLEFRNIELSLWIGKVGEDTDVRVKVRVRALFVVGE